MFGTIRKSNEKPPKKNNCEHRPSSMQDRIRSVKSRWNAQERQFRREMAEHRLQHLVCLLGLNDRVEAA